MSVLPDPNAQSPAGDGQTDYKAEYVKLSAQIANGDYVLKNVYTGLQQTHEKQVLAHKADKDAVAALQAKAEAAEAASKTLLTQAEEYKAKFEAEQVEAAKAKAGLERTKLVMSKFPELVELEGGGLLPQAPIAELEGILKLFSEKLGTMQQNTKQQKMAGAGDPPAGTGSQTTPTAKQLLDEANIAARAGNWTEYNSKLDAYHAELNKH